jgi:hypothetical protein
MLTASSARKVLECGLGHSGEMKSKKKRVWEHKDKVELLWALMDVTWRGDHKIVL